MLSIAHIYKITAPDTDRIYIGSTTQTIERRFTSHKSKYKQYLNGKYHFISSFGLMDKNGVTIELIQTIENITKTELMQTERSYIDLYRHCCVNLHNPFITDDERLKLNAKRQIEYREANRDSINAKRNARVTCPLCGCQSSRKNISTHQKTNKCKQSNLS